MMQNVVQKMQNVIKMNENDGPKIMQNVVQKEWKLYSNAKCNRKNNARYSPNMMQNVVEK